MKKFLCVLIAVIMALGVVSCANSPANTATETGKTSSGSATASQIKSSKDTIVVAVTTDVRNLDPNDVNSQNPRSQSCQIYETLVRKDANGKLIPWLATSWEWEDDKTLVFHLRKGVKFHNGDEMKANDVLFSLKRCTKMTSAFAVSHIDFEKSSAVDDYTVKLIMAQPFFPQVDYLEWPLTAISCERSFKESGGDYWKAPVGTGAFKYSNYVSGDRLELVANHEYWGDGPYVEKLIFRVIPENSMRTMELETGGADVAAALTAADVKSLSDSKVNIARGMGLATRYFIFKTSMEPFNNVKVREAISYAIDKETVWKTAYKDSWSVAKGLFGSTIQDFAEDVKLPVYDTAKAKTLLAEAGFPNGFSMTITTQNMQTDMDMAEVIQNQLGAVGINCKVDVMETGAFVEAYTAGKLGCMILGMTATTGEASRALGWFCTDHSLKKCWDWQNDKAKKFTELVYAAAGMKDEAARYAANHEAQEILAAELPVYPLVYNELIYGLNQKLKGFVVNPTFECPLYKDCYFE